MKQYKFFLDFKNDNYTIELEEPFMFDAFTHGLERKSGMWAIDMHLFAENSELLFTNDYYSKCNQYTDIDGAIVTHLSHGLKNILDAYEEYGPDADIEFRILFREELLTKCYLDLEEIESDGETYFKCGCIENSVRSKHKLREDDVIVNLYANKDIDGNDVIQLQPKKVLLKSKAIQTSSQWIKTDIPYSGAPDGVTNKFPAGSGIVYFNFCKNPILYGINDTLVPLPFTGGGTASISNTYDGDMKIIDSKTTKSNVVIKCTQDLTVVHKWNGRTGWTDASSLKLYARVSYGTGPTESVVHELYSVAFTGQTTQSVTVPSEISYTLPEPLREGEFLTIWWQWFWTESTVALTTDYSDIDNYSHIVVNDCKIDVTCSETTVNSVIQGIRWIDFLKKSAELISGLPVDAPMIDVGGEYYDTICTNGGGVRNIDNIPFNTKVRDAFETGNMVALDYQITENDIKVGSYSDFFSDRLLRTFNVKPDEKFTWNTNKMYRIKTFDYIFKNFEQDRAEQSTLDAVHTEAQFLLPNLKTKDVKKIQIDQIVDAYKIDSLRRLGLDTQTKDSSLTDDTDLVFLNVENIDEGHFEYHTGIFYINSTTTGIKIVSKLFRWDKIGLSIDSYFEILTGANAGVYSVSNIETTLLTLTAVSVPSNSTINEIITIKYSIPGVEFIVRTNEGFSNIEGILSPNNYGNLMYSIKRNMRNWLPFLATCGMHFLSSSIKNSFFKSNGNLVTKLSSETENVVDKADIVISDIANLKRVTDRKFKIDIFIDNPNSITEIFTEVNTRNVDGSIGGYYEFKDVKGRSIKGYPDKLDYLVKENKIEALCKEKYESDYFDILDIDKTNYSSFEANGIYINLYDVNNLKVFTKKRFTRIKINGILYSNINTFINDLQIYFS